MTTLEMLGYAYLGTTVFVVGWFLVLVLRSLSAQMFQDLGLDIMLLTRDALRKLGLKR
jgi:hypothetical protein